ncbi:MAG: DEAD/DEAH box helicase [Myxococcales bacterium]|nr:DEAD/DEAH box helicase [Myxococcales bacterium]
MDVQYPGRAADGAGDGDADGLARFHPLVAGWFRERLGPPTAPQRAGWPAIARGQDTLIAAPTGSGKTLAAFLACLDALVRAGLRAPLPDATAVLYVSPLKALSNDVSRNLELPLRELGERAARQGVRFPDIRIAVRTGDTPAGERARMMKRPPHVLVTTPESLYILLTSGRGRAALGQVGTVIVDEIHALAGDKRGAHLALSLERLDRLVAAGAGRPPVRVGLSATQRPIERVAELLVGARRPPPVIVDGGHRRDVDLAIEITDDELGAVASLEQLGRVHDRIAELVGQHRTTLVFVNTRRMVERVAHQLEERLGEDQVVAHHGSMSRELRLRAEERLKSGAVRCAVATASLELGIDVGAVDLVVQLGSPRSLATFLQRVGRSGHHLGATPKGRLFALTRDQLVECAALVRGVRRGNLDELQLRDAPLDILAQQMVAVVAAEGEAGIGEDELFALVTAARPYAALTRARFDELVAMLAEGVSERRRIGQLLHRDRVGGRLKARRGARLLAITSGGAIPDNANYAVVEHPSGTRVGEVDEDFAIDSMAGDVFLLGNTAWKIHRIETGRVFVEDARGQPPTIPFWFGEAPARTRELSDEVSDLRREVDRRLADGVAAAELAAWLVAETSMSRGAAAQLVAYLAAGRAALGALPRRDLLVAERFFDEGGGMQLVLHAPLGGRVNRAWGLALRKRFCRSFDFELQAAATDDGIVISLGQPHSFPLDSVFGFLPSAQAVPVLTQALLDAPMFEVRWRWNVTRALTVARRHGGKKVAPHLVRMRAADLLSVVFPQAQACLENIPGDRDIPDHPLVFETIRDCLVEAMDGEGLTALCAALERGEIEVLARDTVEPSPLCHELLNANPYAFLDDAPLEERRTRAVNLRRGLPAELAETTGALAPEAIAAAEDEVAPVVRDPDELHDLLLTQWLVPALLPAPAAAWQPWLAALAAAGRATRLDWTCAGAPAAAWVATERLGAMRAVVPAEAVASPPLEVPAWAERPEPEVALRRLVAAQLDVSGPRTAHALAERLGLPAPAVVDALLALEADGDILRGAFTGATGPRFAPATTLPAVRAADGAATADDLATRVEWCNRRVLARIHRLTLARLRREIEPVDAATLVRFLLRWQRVARGSQLIGADGLARVVEQLGGFETAAGAWEREVLPARLHGYDPSWLDQMCLGGEVAWCRLSPRRPASGGAGADDAAGERAGDGEAGAGRLARPAPSRAAPLALFRRADAAWLRAPTALRDLPPPELSAEATAVAERLRTGGAAFLADLCDELAPGAVEDALWELVGAGLASADGFASMRVLVERRRGEGASRFDRPRQADAALPAAHAWREAVRRARGKERARPGHAVRSLPTAAGRWSLLGPPRAEHVDAERSARQLLARYGVVFRDLLARETALPPWRDLAVALRRLEARGELRGGRFVNGFVGEQFALPEALDELRALRGAPPLPELCRVAATDPLNLVGILSPGPRVPAVLGNAVLYRDGVPLASLESGEVVVRVALEPGARIDDDLTYHAPPRRPAPAPQATLPL